MGKPIHIRKNHLAITGLDLKFEVIVLKEIPKEVFLNSDVPEEVILAILCDFGDDQPEEVVRQILNNLSRILRKTNRLKKFQKQLLVLSRLRKVEVIVKTQIDTMAFHYDIETDGLYLLGIQEGIKEGIEQGLELEKREFIQKLWSLQEFPLSKIAFLVDLSIDQVIQVIATFLQTEGFTEIAALEKIAAYQERFK